MLEYRQAIPDDFDDILSISSKQLGEKYLNKDELKNIFDSEKSFLPVAIKEDRLVAYSIIFLDELGNLSTYGLEKCLEYLYEISHDSVVQIRKTTAVHPDFTGKGIGSRLVNYGLMSLENECDLILSINWKQKEVIPMAGTSVRNGMKVLCEVEDYWKEESIERRFICPECGQPPCTCKAVIYYKKGN